MVQTNTPLYNVLKLHSSRKPISFHVPGHKNGQVFPEEGRFFFKDILKIDATELSGLDDLHSPEGAILEAEQLLADLYHTKRSFFLINGTTGGNLGMILASVREDDIVLVQRNCHKSILNGISLAGAEPVYLGPEFDEDWKIAGAVPYETVERAIQLHPEAKAIILTYPNYYGLVYELEKIIGLAHQHGIPVLIDEAHGAHFIAGDPFPQSAVELGADIVVQSAHKTLPAMTMGSFLHFNSKIVPVEKIIQYLQMVQSSSPSYPIMASLDLARSYMGTYTQADKAYLLNRVQIVRENLKNIDHINVLSYKKGWGDPLKLTVQSNSSLSGFELQQRLEEQGIYSELADPFNILFVLPLLKEDQKFPFDLVTDKMAKAFKGTSAVLNKKQFFYKKQDISIPALDREAMSRLHSHSVSLKDAAGFISAELIIPYPPGIPSLYPGELITKGDIDYLNLLLESGARFQGGEKINERKIKVYIG